MTTSIWKLSHNIWKVQAQNEQIHSYKDLLVRIMPYCLRWGGMGEGEVVIQTKDTPDYHSH